MEDKHRGDDFQRHFNPKGGVPHLAHTVLQPHLSVETLCACTWELCNNNTHTHTVCQTFFYTYCCTHTYHDRPELTRDCTIWRCSDAHEDKSMKKTKEKGGQEMRRRCFITPSQHHISLLLQLSQSVSVRVSGCLL